MPGKRDSGQSRSLRDEKLLDQATIEGYRDRMVAMKRWVRKLNSFEEERAADREFWEQLSPDERVAAVEELRLEWIKIRGERNEGFRRTARVLKIAKG